MKYNHNANIELKTGRNRSYTIIPHDDGHMWDNRLIKETHPTRSNYFH